MSLIFKKVDTIFIKLYLSASELKKITNIKINVPYSWDHKLFKCTSIQLQIHKTVSFPDDP